MIDVKSKADKILVEYAVSSDISELAINSDETRFINAYCSEVAEFVVKLILSCKSDQNLC